MRTLLVLLGLVTSVVSALAPRLPGPSRGKLTPGTLAIVGVNVVPMTRDTVLRDATVLVRDGRIVQLGPRASVRIPAGARRIDGGGAYLVPGLVDVHTHLFADEEFPDSIAPDELALMVANGVTTARLMIGTPEHLVLRRQIEEGSVLGPQLWVASPAFTGRDVETNERVVTTPEAARAAVREVAEAGYEFIKLTNFITPPVYDAIVDETRKAGLRVVGHVEPSVGVRHALESGQQIEHLDAYFEGVLADSSPIRASVTQGGLFRLGNWRSLDYVDDRKVTELAVATARAPGWASWFSPTLNVFDDAFAAHPTDAEIRARPEWALLPTRWRDRYLGARTRYWADSNEAVRTEARRQRFVAVRERLVRTIVDSGGKLLAGSDTPEWFHLYGWGLHRELAAYVAAGLTPYQALAAATRNPAEFLGASAEWGTIAPGRRADLVLVDGNPLQDITSTQRIRAVAVGGRWLDRAALDALVARAARTLPGP
jgi:imidazolonepropionase-like amidohydrolase